MAEENIEGLESTEGLAQEELDYTEPIEDLQKYKKPLSVVQDRRSLDAEYAQLEADRYALSGGLVGRPMGGTKPDMSNMDQQGTYLPSDVDGHRGTQDAANELINTIATTNSYASNPFKFTAPTSFGTNRFHYNVKRYKETPGDNYEKLGFSPWRDNEAYYDEHMSDWGDARRASKSFWLNMETGWDSYWGNWSNPDPNKDIITAERFAEDAATYNSRRGTNLGMLGNTTGMVGLGVGMAFGFMVETGVTGLLTGGTSLPGNVARGGAKGLSMFQKYKRATNAMKGLGKASNLKKIWDAGRTGMYNTAGSIARGLTPNSVQWYNTIAKSKDMSAYSKLYKGFGYFYKDYAIAKMAQAEAKMEGGLVYQEVEARLLREFRDEHGRDPSTEEFGALQGIADKAAESTFNKNFLLVWGTNMITFNKMFTGFGAKTLKNFDRSFVKNARGQVIANSKKGASVSLSGVKETFKGGIGATALRTGKALITPKAWGQTALNTGRGFMKYTKANFAEGVQELTQEVISDTESDYYSSVYWSEHGNAMVGDYYHMAGKNAQTYISPAGYEIFMSGFLMGGIMGGGQNVISKGTEFAQSSGVLGKTTKAKYKTYMKNKEAELEKIAKSYNEIAAEPLKYFDPNLENLVKQKTIQKQQDIAKDLGDKKVFHGLKEEAEFYNIKVAIDTGHYDLLQDQLQDYKNLTIEQFNQATRAAVKTETEQFELIDGMIERSEEIKEGYEEAIEQYPNLHNPNLFNPNTPEYKESSLKHLAHNAFIEQYSMATHKFRRAIQRKAELYGKVKKQPWYKFKKFRGLESTGARAQQIDILLDAALMSQELGILNIEIDELNKRSELGTLTKEEKAELKRKKKLSDVYHTYDDARTLYVKSIKNEEVQYDSERNETGKYSEKQIKEQEAALEGLQKAWVNAIKAVAEIEGQDAFDMNIEDAFLEVKDMLELDDDASKFRMAVNWLTAPGVYEDQMLRASANIDVMNGRRGEMIMKHLTASFERRENGAFEALLQNAGFILTEEGYVQIYDEFTVPDSFIDLSNDNAGELVSAPDPRYYVAVGLVEDFLTHVKKAGVTTVEYDAQLKEEADKKAEETAEEEEDVAPTRLTMLDETGNSNLGKWDEIPGLQDEVTKLFEEDQKRRTANPNLEPFDSIDDWVESRPDKLAAVLRKYNTSRNEEYKKNKAAKAKKKREAAEAEEKAGKKGESPVEKQSADELALVQMINNLTAEEELIAKGEGSEEVAQTYRDGIAELEAKIAKTNAEAAKKKAAEEEATKRREEEEAKIRAEKAKKKKKGGPEAGEKETEKEKIEREWAETLEPLEKEKADLERQIEEKDLKHLIKEKEQIEKEIEEIERKQGSQGKTSSGAYNNAINTFLAYSSSLGNKARALARMIANNKDLTFKEKVDYILEKTGETIEYTDALKRVDEKYSKQELKDLNLEAQNAQQQISDKTIEDRKQVLKDNNLSENKKYSLEELASIFPFTGVSKIIYDIIKGTLVKLDITVEFTSDFITPIGTSKKEGSLRGSHDPLTGEILISADAISSFTIAEVLVHEAVHAVTSKIINLVRSGDTKGLTTKQIKAVKGLEALYNKFKNDYTGWGYPVSDIHEFIAHLTNAEFVKELEKRDKTFIQSVVDFLLDIFGINNANDLAKKYLTDIISNPVSSKNDIGNIKGSTTKLSQLKQRLAEVNKKTAALETTPTSEVEVNPVTEDEVMAVAVPRTFFADRIDRIKKVISGKRKGKISGSVGSLIASPVDEGFNEKDSKDRFIADGGSQVYLSKEENSEYARIEAKRKQGMITAAEKSDALQEVIQGAFKRALATYEVVEDAPILKVKERVEAFKAQPTQQSSEVEAKKAAIEKRRAIEINKRAPYLTVIEDGTGVNKGILQYTLYHNLPYMDYEYFHQRSMLTGGSNSTREGYENNVHRILNNRLSDAELQASYGAQTIIDSINAKYNAELAALETTQTSEVKELLADLKKRLKVVNSKIDKVNKDFGARLLGAGSNRGNATGDSYFTPVGNTVQEKVDSVITQLQKNQASVKKFGSLSAAERALYDVKEGAHGYMVLVEGQWVKAISTTQAMGSTFELQAGNRVEILNSNDTAQIIEGPVENPDRMTDDASTDTYKVRLESNGEELELTKADLNNITFIDSTIAGTRVDEIVRDFFLNKISESDKAPEGIDPKAYRELIKSLKEAKKFFDSKNLTVLANNIILFDANAPGGVIAGEIDLLAYNADTGRFYIYDMKTSKNKFWEVDPKTKGLRAPKLNVKFTDQKHSNVRGLSRTKKGGYELQQSIYKNLFEKQYGAMIGTTGESGIALMPFHITYDKEGNIKTLTRESNIQLNYRPEAEEWTDAVDVKPIALAEGEGTGRSIQPDSLEGKGFTDSGVGIPTVDTIFDRSQETVDSLHDGRKITALRLHRKTPKVLQGILDAAYMLIGTRRFKAISYGKVNSVQAGERIKKLAQETAIQVEQLRAQGRPVGFRGAFMTEAMSKRILAVDEMDINNEDKDKLRIAIAEGLPISQPASWKTENPITIAGTTYYAPSSEITKFMNGNGSLILMNVIPFDEVDLTPDMMEDQYNIYDQFAEKVEAIGSDKDALTELRKEINQWMLDTNASSNGQVSGYNELSKLLKAKESELENTVGFSALEQGDILTVKSAEIVNFGELVTIVKHNGNYVTVRNLSNPELTTKENGKLKTISKSNFDSIVESINDNSNMEAPVEKEEAEAGKKNMTNVESLTHEEEMQLLKDAESQSMEDILGELKDDANKNCV